MTVISKIFALTGDGKKGVQQILESKAHTGYHTVPNDDGGVTFLNLGDLPRGTISPLEELYRGNPGSIAFAYE